MSSSSPDDISPAYTEDDLILGTFVAYLYGKDGIVSSLYFRAQEEQKITKNGDFVGFRNIFDSKTFGEWFRPYMLPQVLSEQGIPAAVLLQTYGALSPHAKYGSFDILLFYPDQGLLVHYLETIL